MLPLPNHPLASQAQAESAGELTLEQLCARGAELEEQFQPTHELIMTPGAGTGLVTQYRRYLDWLNGLPVFRAAPVRASRFWARALAYQLAVDWRNARRAHGTLAYAGLSSQYMVPLIRLLAYFHMSVPWLKRQLPAAPPRLSPPRPSVCRRELDDSD